MATNTGRTIANTYKNLLNIDNNNSGVDGTVRTVQDGEGTSTPLQLSNSILNVNGTLQLNGVAITADASAINNITDLTAITGIVATSGGSAFGRTLTGGTGVSITNADGTEGNPTIALDSTGVSAATYGPFSDITVNAVGQITSIAPQTSVSIAKINTALISTTDINASSDVSIGGTTNITGQATFSSGITVSGTTSVQDMVATTIQATRLDVAEASIGTLTVTGFGTSLTDLTVNNIVNIATAVFNGTVSAASIDADELLMAGVSAATVTEVAAVSVLTQTNLDSITSINTVTDTINSAITSINSAYVSVSSALETRIASVSALTSVNLEATTSITSRITALSATFATSIANVSALTQTNADAITSINAAYTSVSAALETRIASVSALTSVNSAAITSINSAYTSVSAALETRIAAVSALTSANLAAIASVSTALESRIAAVSVLTSVNLAAITSVSAALETRIAAVSVLTSVNTAALAATSAALATSITNYLPLTGGAITGDVSVSGTLDFKTNVFGQRTSLTDAASIAVDLGVGNHFIVQLGGNRTLAAPTNLQPTQTGSILFIQDGTGSRTLSFNSVWKFPAGTAPTISTVSGTVDRIDFEVYTSSAVHAVATLDLQ